TLDTLLTVWGPDGRVVQPYPIALDGWTLFNAATIADVDGDGVPEIIASSDGGGLHGYRVDGTEAAGFPKFIGGWLIAAASVGDLDGDGQLELVASTREGKLFAWHLTGASCTGGRPAVRWLGGYHDLHNTASTDGDGTPPAAVADAHVDGGAIVFTAV